MKKIIDWIGIENTGQRRIHTVFLSLYTLAFGYMFIKATFEHILFSALLGYVFAGKCSLRIYHFVSFRGENPLLHHFVCENSFLIWAFFSIFFLFPLPFYGLFFINRKRRYKVNHHTPTCWFSLNEGISIWTASLIPISVLNQRHTATFYQQFLT